MSGLTAILSPVMITEQNKIELTDEEILKMNEESRTKCDVWTRTMGYHRPISSMNAGKQGEHGERVYFKEPPCPVCR